MEKITKISDQNELDCPNNYGFKLTGDLESCHESVQGKCWDLLNFPDSIRVKLGIMTINTQQSNVNHSIDDNNV
jgi:hypothetical protein